MRKRRMGHHHDGGILPLHGEVATLSENRRRRRRSRQNKNCMLTLGLSMTIMGFIVLIFLRWSSDDQNAMTVDSSHSGALPMIRCDDGTTVLGRMNDDYCDCPDGSDEKLTSACSNILVQKATFRCRDDSNIVVFPSRVRDGVKDCADGSDED